VAQHCDRPERAVQIGRHGPELVLGLVELAALDESGDEDARP
jgi:hypothetical protein